MFEHLLNTIVCLHYCVFFFFLIILDVVRDDFGQKITYDLGQITHEGEREAERLSCCGSYSTSSELQNFEKR